jgi:AraC-like DNA-binding protein
MTTTRSPQPSLIVRELKDFDDFRDLFGAWGGQFQQISRGRFRGTAAIYAGLYVRAFRAETNQAIFTRGLDQTDLVTVIPITAGNENTSWRGRQLAKGNLLIKGPDVEYYNQTTRNTVIDALLVPLDTFTTMAGSFTDAIVGHKCSSSIAFRPSGEVMRKFRASLDALLTSPGSANRYDAEVMERACLDNLSMCLLCSDTDMKKLGVKRLELIDAALDLMNERFEGRLKSEDFCAALQVNDRMLRRVFKQAFGMGPMAIYRQLRLNRLRHELKSARGSGQTVAALANRCGFRRLGALAAEYQTLFGELPSETLGVRGHVGIQRAMRQEPAT